MRHGFSRRPLPRKGGPGTRFPKKNTPRILPWRDIFFETGLGLNFARTSEDESWTDDYSYGYPITVDNKWSTTTLGLTIPLNIVWGVKINDMLAIKPYTGFYLRVNVMSKNKYKTEVGIPSDMINDMRDYGYSQSDIDDAVSEESILSEKNDELPF